MKYKLVLNFSGGPRAYCSECGSLLQGPDSLCPICDYDSSERE